MLSFRGTLRAEESLLRFQPKKERFLTLFGMTSRGTFSVAFQVVRRSEEALCHE